MPDLALAVLVLLPFAITFFLKSNAALGFLVLCLGFVLSTSVIGDLKQLLSQTSLSVSSETLGIALVFVPFVVTLVLTHKSAGKDATFLMQLITALLAGGLLALTIGPLLASAGQFDITSSKMWPNILKAQALIIGSGSLFSIILVWLGSIKHGKSKHR